MPFNFGFGELILIFAVLLLVFGAKRLPEIGGAMGKSIRDFKRTINGLDDSSPEPRREPPQVTASQPTQQAPASPAQPEVVEEPRR